MPTVIRLLPRKKIERHVVPYTRLLATVLTKRFLMAARVLALINFILALVMKPLLAVPLMRAWLYLCGATACCLILFKAQFVAEPRAFVSVAREILYKTTTKSTWAALLGYTCSMAVYFRGILAPSTSWYSTRRASYRPLPEGIPPSLALHRTDQWYVLNEKYQYGASFGVGLVLVYTVAFAVMNGNVLRFDPSESGKKPAQRLISRFSALSNWLVLWLGCASAWPIVYFAAIRSTRWSPLQIAGTVALSGFKLSYVLLPFFYLPLCMAWATSYEVLTAYLSLGPIFKGKPLTEATQSDRNGSLVDGVSRPSGSLSTLTAWYELLVVAEHYEERRRSIFNDVDRERVVWDQLHQQFLQLVSRQLAILKPKAQPEKATTTKPKADHKPRASILPVGNEQKSYSKRLVVHEKSAQLYKPESALEKKLASYAHYLESESTTWANRVYAYSKRWYDRLLKASTDHFEDFLATRFGALFRKTVPRRLAVLLPHRQETAFAVRAIARMTTHSLKEDENGFVQGTIASTLSCLDKLARELEALVANPPIDTSDVLVRRKLLVADAGLARNLLGEVNSAFAETVETFEPYFKNLGVDKAVQERAALMHKGELVMAEAVWLL